VSALICSISTFSFLNCSWFARNPLTWFFHPPVNANGRNDTTVGRPRKLASVTFWSVCEASVKSGAALPGWSIDFSLVEWNAVIEEYARRAAAAIGGAGARLWDNRLHNRK
jgi:hypothetical protein